MSEGTLASAVAVPEQESIRQSPEYPKRRHSSISDNEPKRRRLSAQGDTSPHSQRRRPSSPHVAEQAGENPPPKGRREEDRKRGKRLFGALLGTLSQSSNSAAQKRREGIEKRQQDKLKNQASEYDGLKKKRKERRETIRAREKPFYEREAMETRHAHMLASAHFLKTHTQPVLYYKPWQSRRGDDDIIREQIEEAESKIANEVADFERQYPPESFVHEQLEPLSATNPEDQPGPENTQQQPAESHETKEELNKEGTAEQAEVQHEPSKVEAVPTESDASLMHEDHDVHRDDDGGEVVEDNEDTVIY